MSRGARSRLVVLALIGALGTAAQANVWDDAVKRGKPDPAQDTYDMEMRSGDEHAVLANARGLSRKEVLHQVQLAITSYKNAAAAKPKEGEPYFRIGRTLYSFFIECNDVTISPALRSPLCNPDPRAFDRKHAEEIIEAWNAFEARAPLDPRVGVGVFGESEILFRRAILHTKLATRPNLEAAAEDYEKILARQDAAGDGISENVVGNLAETYMMLNRMDEAIDMYKTALRGGGAGETSTWYGFAVALDRDERTQQALEVIQSLGDEQRNAFHRKVIAGETFFVPEGEKHYYFALSDEAFGLDEEAIDNWKKYIASGAHPEFQPRAKAHLDALMKKKRKGGALFDPPWRGILR